MMSTLAWTVVSYLPREMLVEHDGEQTDTVL